MDIFFCCMNYLQCITRHEPDFMKTAVLFHLFNKNTKYELFMSFYAKTFIHKYYFKYVSNRSHNTSQYMMDDGKIEFCIEIFFKRKLINYMFDLSFILEYKLIEESHKFAPVFILENE